MGLPERSLEELARHAGEGDAGSFKELFALYHDRVFKYATSRVGAGVEAQDVLQEIFLAVWRGLPSFRYEHEGSFPAWLFGIARNVVGTHLRQRGRALEVPLEGDLEETVGFEEETVSKHLLSQLLDSLPESQREVLVLRFVVGLRAKEVGEAIGKSEGAVNALQVRGLRALSASMMGSDG